LKKNIEYINWYNLSTNKNPNAITLIKNNLDKFGINEYRELCSNPNAIELLKQNQEKINWDWLSENPNAIELLKQNPDKINWKMLSKNPNAIEFLEQNQHKIDWFYLSYNPAIFTYDYEKIKKDNEQLNKELIEYIWHPLRIFP